MALVKFITQVEEAVAINPEHVVAVRFNSFESTHILTTGTNKLGSSFVVQGNFDEVVDRLGRVV